MQIQSADQIIERIAEAHREAKDGVVAFDGDGTLWSGDVGEDFFHALMAHKDFRPSATEQMKRDAREFGITDEGDGGAIASRLYAEYLAGKFPEERICELMTWCCAEWTTAEVARFTTKMLEGNVLDERLHAEAIQVVTWARRQKLEVFIVSASPRPIVEEAAKVVGIGADHVVAATPEWLEGRMLPRVLRPIPYGPGKVSSLRAKVGARTLCAAFGDNAFDVALLSEAKVPVAVRPKPRLRNRAAEVPALVEIAQAP